MSSACPILPPLDIHLLCLTLLGYLTAIGKSWEVIGKLCLLEPWGLPRTAESPSHGMPALELGLGDL
jgi:hypothetical protein